MRDFGWVCCRSSGFPEAGLNWCPKDRMAAAANDFKERRVAERVPRRKEERRVTLSITREAGVAKDGRRR